MLVKFHKGFILEGEAAFKKRKHFWSKAESVREKIYCPTSVYGVCDDTELEAEVEKQIKNRLNSNGWGRPFYGWLRVLNYDESVVAAKEHGWAIAELPECQLTTETLDDWTVEKAAKELNGRQFAQYCRDYGIYLKGEDING
jgi:hypothetical protein